MAQHRRPSDCAFQFATCDLPPSATMSCPLLGEPFDAALHRTVFLQLFRTRIQDVEAAVKSALQSPQLISPSISSDLSSSLSSVSVSTTRSPAPHPSTATSGSQTPSQSSSHSSSQHQSRLHSTHPRHNSHIPKDHPTERFQDLQRMISKAKQLMYQIRAFDQEFSRKHNHAPKRGDRAPIADKVEQYKTMRNELRDFAAVLIQSTWRMYKAKQYAEQMRKERQSFLSNPLPLIERRLIVQRRQARRSEDMHQYSHDVNQLRAEKQLVKMELKRFDKIFTVAMGRSPGRYDKEPLRSLYQRYKTLTSMLSQEEARQGRQSPPDP
ncbi:hypothetical protein BLNAU_17930 [Blattamonas nauphoetae]|uniref:FAM13A-like domain-containing protein n=1 Tax=Blattamonas nauphoetae TaxID=2049346 RepID=A0ABQ9X753_9EUKA|nr:hypothetical protein BLNAU_17930 [Blattamonas nauphoetae]